MSRWILLVCLLTLPLVAVGCSMCCGPYDYDYPMFESNYARTDPVYGRVGSIFSDPNVMPEGPRPLTNADVENEDDSDIDDDEGPDDPDFRFDDPEIDPFEGVDPDQIPDRETSSGTQTERLSGDGWR